MAKPGIFNIEDFLKVEKKIFVLILMVIFIVVMGMLTFMFVEQQPVEDALFNTFASAVGYGFHFSKVTVVVTTFIMILEWACLWIAFDTIVEFISAGKVRELMGGMKMKKGIDKLNEHCILCGFGRVGAEIARNLNRSKCDMVIVERDAHSAKTALARGHLVIQGDVLSEDVLKEAGLERAKILIAAMGSDADNVFLTLTAKGLCPKIRVVARAEREESVKKLKQAGAAEVIMPSAIGGKAMADAIIRS